MKALDLRIGNYVKAPLGEIMRVDQVGHLDFPDYIHARNETEFGQNGFKGIALTPEILEKCGFDRYTEVPNDGIGDKLEVFEGLYGVVFFFDVHGALVFKDYHSNMNRPKYLHQLQNLYFALTGEELEVKL